MIANILTCLSLISTNFTVYNTNAPIKIENDSPLILTSLPNSKDRYYKDMYPNILKFNSDMSDNSEGNNVINLNSSKNFSSKYDDIWIRDVAPVVTNKLVKFRYSPKYLSKNYSRKLDRDFTSWLKTNKFKFTESKLILDGGNFVYNGKDTAIITNRVFDDNKNYSKKDVISTLKNDLGLKKIVIVTPEYGDVLAHTDGMLCFIKPNTLLISDFENYKQVEKEISQQLPNIKFIKLSSGYTSKGQYDSKIPSARGVYTNILETDSAIYVPQYSLKKDKEIIETLRKNTDKKIIPVDVSKISTMGGSVHCLTWYCPNKFLPH
ncbi:agmatine deiminase family protein [Lactobacillus terrae]|uniref:agmatine deiminase family protein n=1 Tax=Lactobacillus terrae TaxID=2269374 RepID=UPI000C1B7600|nr:agmatine deiminase family protein [Lactobacillus terrae]